MEQDYRPRFIFEITEEQNDRASRVFSHYGMRRAIFSPLLDEVMDMIEEHGYIVVSVLIDKSTSLRKVIPSLARAEKVAKSIKEGAQDG